MCEDTDGDGLGNPGTQTEECIDGGRDVEGGCDLPDLNLYVTSDGSVFYNSSEDIGGFQFNVEGAAVIGGSGGDSGDAGFLVSAGGSTVLAFSMTGAVIPAGCGTLLNLSLDGEANGLSSIVVSNAIGGSLSFSYYVDSGSDLVFDCTDEYPDCAANVLDCLGECGGSAVEDECGVCNGDGISDGACDCDGNVLDCLGECGGSAVEDECGVCNLSLIH